MEQFLKDFMKQLNLEIVDIRTYSPLSLAYIGDSVFDFFVKFYLVSQGNKPVNDYHRESKTFVKASEQAAMLEAISHLLTEEEVRIVRWGRNSKSQSMPKNAERSDYQKATSFECLLGYLLLTQQFNRLKEIMIEGILHGKANTGIN